MSISYIICDGCGCNFPDCGNYICCDACWRNFCGDKCAGLKPTTDPYNDAETDCVICRKEFASDQMLFNALLKHFNLTREQAMCIWSNQK